MGCAQKARMLRVAPRLPLVGKCSSMAEHQNRNLNVTGSNPVVFKIIEYNLKQKCATLGS